MLRIAAIQLASGPNLSTNLSEAARLILGAAERGVGLVVLPENFAMIGMSDQDNLHISEPAGEGPIQQFLAQQAKQHRIWLVGGTLPLKTGNPHKVRAACLVFDDHGKQVARYDKQHLFDVRLAEGTENYTESETIEPGDTVSVVDTPFGRLGVAVCYDLRFPELFRCMLDQGMELIALPSAFTAITGQAHWEILVRARAIENLCYVVAAAQSGSHVNGRKTYGHSMIVDPWGKILSSQAHGPGVICADLERELLTHTRRQFPALLHRRLFCTVKTDIKAVDKI